MAFSSYNEKNGVGNPLRFLFFFQLIENIVGNLIAKRIAVPRRAFVAIGITATSAHTHKKHRAQKQRQQNFKSLFHGLLRFEKQPPLTTSKGRLCLQRIILLYFLQRELLRELLRELQQELLRELR